MGGTWIRVSETAKARLDLHKREGESYTDVIMSLTSRDKWAGFGIASGDPEAASEGLDNIRADMREQMARDINDLKD